LAPNRRTVGTTQKSAEKPSCANDVVSVGVVLREEGAIFEAIVLCLALALRTVAGGCLKTENQ
jgi:hypothetical protein